VTGHHRRDGEVVRPVIVEAMHGIPHELLARPADRRRLIAA
jgi:hypothetical protein